MEFRHSMDDPSREIETAAFCEMVRAGQVKPTALYRTKWTDNEWRTVDNFPPFHRYSPVKHPPGRHLAEELAADKRRDEQGEIFRKRMQDYTAGTLIEIVLGAPPLDDLLCGGAVLGVARLCIMPAFAPESLITLCFMPDSLELRAVRGLTSIWESIPQTLRVRTSDGSWVDKTESVHFDRAQIRGSRADVKYDDVPDLFRSWLHYAEALRSIGSCESMAVDGVGYRHKLLIDGGLVEVHWDNPMAPEHAPQVAVVNAYSVLLRGAGLADFDYPE